MQSGAEAVPMFPGLSGAWPEGEQQAGFRARGLLEEAAERCGLVDARHCGAQAVLQLHP